MKLNVEKYYPITFSVIIPLISGYFHIFGNKLPDLIEKLADNGISISVTLVGFFLTILTLLNSIDTHPMRVIKKMNAFKALLSYLSVAIIGNILMLLASFLIKYIEHRQDYVNNMLFDQNPFDLLYVGIFLFAILTSYRFTKLFIKLLTDN